LVAEKISRKKTFSKILVAIHESSKSEEKAIDYAARIALDYDAVLVVLYVVRGHAKLGTVTPSHVIDLKKQAQAHITKFWKRYKSTVKKILLLKLRPKLLLQSKSLLP